MLFNSKSIFWLWLSIHELKNDDDDDVAKISMLCCCRIVLNSVLRYIRPWLHMKENILKVHIRRQQNKRFNAKDERENGMKAHIFKRR